MRGCLKERRYESNIRIALRFPPRLSDRIEAGLTLVQTRKLQARVRQDQELQKQQAQDAEARADPRLQVV